MNKKSQGGFTLIELVVVIVIIGILAATAVPKFINLSSDAATASAQGLAGAINSAAAVNYGASLARGSTGTNIVQVGVADASCSAVLGSLLQSWDSASYSITGSVASTCAAGATSSCGVSHTATGSTSTTATVICVG